MKRTAASCKRKITSLLLVVLLAGCASGEMLHDRGLDLLDEGKYEQGLAKLAQAVKADPQNGRYRTSFERNRERVIDRIIVSGNNERIAGHADAARADYLRALKIDRNNDRALHGLAALEMDKRHGVIIAEAKELMKKGDLAGARDALDPVLMEDPDQSAALDLKRQIDYLIQQRKSKEPSLTAKFRRPVTLEFRDANIRMVFEALSRMSGINVLLDKDVKPDLTTSISVTGASVEDTIDLILLQNQLKKKVLSDNTVFVYPNTPEKNREYQDLMIRSFHLTNADPKQMLSMLKAIIKTKDVFINEKTNSIVIRDTPAAIRLAQKMIADQDVPEPEVMMEVEVLEVSRNRLSELGINWPDQFSLTATGAGGANASPTLYELKHINSQGITTSPPLGVTLNLMLQDSDTNILASPRIRARNREKAKIMIGDRVPVITNAITPVSTGTPVVTGSVQYLDVGLKLDVQPDIHSDNRVAIKINMEVSSIVKEVPNAVSGTLAYEVGTRNASTVLQLKDGETQILGGLIDNEDRATANKVPGLGQFPILGRLFSSHGENNTKREIILSITPHIVGRSRIPDAAETEYWSGTAATLRDSQLLLKPMTQKAEAAPVSAAVSHAVLSTPALPAPPAAMQFSWSGPSQAKVGQKFSIVLNAQSVQGMNNLGLQVNYDPAVFKAVNAVEGDVMQQSKLQSHFSKTINQANGQVAIDLSGHGANGATRNGSIATLTFEATGAAPKSQITISHIQPTRSGGHPLPYKAPGAYAMAVSK